MNKVERGLRYPELTVEILGQRKFYLISISPWRQQILLPGRILEEIKNYVCCSFMIWSVWSNTYCIRLFEDFKLLSLGNIVRVKYQNCGGCLFRRYRCKPRAGNRKCWGTGCIEIINF